MIAISPHSMAREIIPDEYSDENGDLTDIDYQTEKVGPQVQSSQFSEHNVKFNAASSYGDNELAAAAYAEGKRLFSELPIEERKHTSAAFLATVAFQQMVAKRKRNATKTKPRTSTVKTVTVKDDTPPRIKTRTTKSSTSKLATVRTPKPTKSAKPSRLVRQVAPEVRKSPFESLGIADLGRSPIQAEVAVFLRWTHRGGLVERVVSAHWATVKTSARNVPIELDIVIDGRDADCEIPEAIPFAENATMEVEVIVDEESLIFEAVRGMFRTQFGVFTLFKFLATSE